jgi:hypothetical protein
MSCTCGDAAVPRSVLALQPVEAGVHVILRIRAVEMPVLQRPQAPAVDAHHAAIANAPLEHGPAHIGVHRVAQVKGRALQLDAGLRGGGEQRHLLVARVVRGERLHVGLRGCGGCGYCGDAADAERRSAGRVHADGSPRPCCFRW